MADTAYQQAAITGAIGRLCFMTENIVCQQIVGIVLGHLGDVVLQAVQGCNATIDPLTVDQPNALSPSFIASQSVWDGRISMGIDVPN